MRLREREQCSACDRLRQYKFSVRRAMRRLVGLCGV